MCGIIAVVSRPSGRRVPDAGWLGERLGEGAGLIPRPGARDAVAALSQAAAALEDVDAALRGVPGVHALLDDPANADVLQIGVRLADKAVEELERWADSGECRLSG